MRLGKLGSLHQHLLVNSQRRKLRTLRNQQLKTVLPAESPTVGKSLPSFIMSDYEATVQCPLPTEHDEK